MRIAILDDYQHFGGRFPGWRSLPQVSVVSFGDHVADEEELVARLQGFQGICRIRERTALSRRVLEGLPDLQIVLATGTRNADSIDLETARKRNITVCSTDSLQRETVEVTWWLILSLLRGLEREAALVRSGGWQFGLGRRLSGKTLGIVGLGKLGVPVSLVARSFEMIVQAWSPNLSSAKAAEHGVRAVSKAELFKTSDVISLHMPLSPSSAGLIGREDIALMKPDAILINTSRAGLLDQEALLDALQAGRIGGFGADVHPEEPLPLLDPFRHLPNVVATPHIGYATQENFQIFFSQSVENLAAFLDGKPIRVIN